MSVEERTVGWLSASDAASVDAAVDLLASELGPYPRERLEKLARAPKARVAVARGASGVMVGVGVGEVRTDTRPFDVFGKEATASLRGRTLGVLSSFAVDSELRKRGIGRTLADALLGWLRGEGCDVLVATSWDWGGPSPSLPGLQRLGFSTLARIDGETYRTANLSGEPCVVCGVPCQCTAILCARALR